MKISFRTFGCKLNQAETDIIKQDLSDKGFLIVPFKQKADITIIRGCGVTCRASQHTREAVRQAKRLGSYVIVNGCVENVDLPEIDFVARTIGEVICHCEERSNLVNDFYLDGAKSYVATRSSLPVPRHSDKTRKFIKIQTGCNFQCAYCIIPTFRGKSSSEPVEKIIQQIKQAKERGYKEVVLTGVNIGQYSYSYGEWGMGNGECFTLPSLLKIILHTTNIPRIRLGSLDPRLIDDELIELYNNQIIKQANNRLMPHWHLSLQSGSNTVLKRMCRGYSIEYYLDIINKLKIVNPFFSFTTDIIVGFPGETEAEFIQTCDFVRQVGFSKVHLFPFSPRPNTPATKMKLVQNKIITKRVKQLTQIVNEVGDQYKRKLVGKDSEILFENKKDGYWFGYCEEYVKIKYKNENNLLNTIKKITLNQSMIL